MDQNQAPCHDPLPYSFIKALRASDVSKWYFSYFCHIFTKKNIFDEYLYFYVFIFIFFFLKFTIFNIFNIKNILSIQSQGGLGWPLTACSSDLISSPNVYCNCLWEKNLQDYHGTTPYYVMLKVASSILDTS